MQADTLLRVGAALVLFDKSREALRLTSSFGTCASLALQLGIEIAKASRQIVNSAEARVTFSLLSPVFRSSPSKHKD